MRAPTWKDRAHAFIATLELPADADAKTCRAIFRQHGSRFHGGTYWGRRAWGKATREYLVRRGLVAARPGPLFAYPDDIVFPYRDGAGR
jgi:hypothetical protein